MNHMVKTVVAVMAMILVSCGGGEKAGGCPELLRAVPSDAIAFVNMDNCRDGLAAVLDSSDVLRRIDFGGLGQSDAVLVFGDMGSVEKILCIDAGRSSEDTSSVAKKILAQAGELGLHSSSVNAVLKRNVLLLSTSESMLKVTSRHIDAGTSILDAQDFDLVLQNDLSDMAVVRNSTARKLFSKMASDIRLPRKLTLDFIGRASEWIVLPYGGDTRKVKAVCSPSPGYFTNFASSLEPGKTLLGEALPATTTFALGMATPDISAWRAEYEKWHDANMKLEKYRRALAAETRKSGTDPLKWEKQMNVREVARLFFDGGDVLLLRPSRASKTSEVMDFEYSAFPALLYGSVFAPSAPECCASAGGWLVIGSREAVEAYLDSEKAVRRDWPRSASYTVCVQDRMDLSLEKENIVLKTRN